MVQLGVVWVGMVVVCTQRSPSPRPTNKHPRQSWGLRSRPLVNQGLTTIRLFGGRPLGCGGESLGEVGEEEDWEAKTHLLGAE